MKKKRTYKRKTRKPEKSKYIDFGAGDSANKDLVQRITGLFKHSPSLSIKFNLLLGMLKIGRNQKSSLRDSLGLLIEEGILYKRGKYYELKEKSTLYEGKIVLDKGFDYAIETVIDGSKTRVKVRKRNLLTALADDIVEFSIIEFSESDTREAIVENIINRASHKIVGNLQLATGRKDYAFVVPDDKKFQKDIYIPSESLKNAKNGDKVVCSIVSWEYQDMSPEGKILEVLGKAGEVETEFKALIKKYGLSKTFPKSIRDEIKEFFEDKNSVIPADEISRRVDYRDRNIFTIDPVDAKDFDDAVQLEINDKGNYLLGVHIADVSYYVKENSETDIEALRRGTSVYLMNDVVPMLPEVLSNDICSLKEGTDRLVFSVIIELSKKGDILNFDLHRSVINSKKRFSYDEVQGIIDKGKGPFLYEVNLMNDLHRILYKKRLQEGSLDFETQEVKATFDKDGNIEKIKPLKRLDSMRMIEDFMLLANKCVTLFIDRKDPRPPFIYRIHDIPDIKRMKELAQFVKQFGIHLNPESKKSIQNMLEKIKGTEEEYLINGLTIRSMAKAVYSEENIGHYGLGFDFYSHFTSPIRRYPDLMVHRILADCKGKMNYKRMNHYREIIPDICKQSTDTEINAVQAEREAVRILQIKYLEKHLGEVFHGIISGVTEYGLYVEIRDNMIEGMIRLRELQDDYYILDERNHQLIGRHRKKIFRLGDRVKVKVNRLDKEKKWIDFVIV
ncbi:MAG: ribonuclease R [Ignavibacteria bacterium]